MKKYIILFVGFGLPLIASADLAQSIGQVGAAVTALSKVLVSLTFVYFVWGLMQYLLGDEKKAAEARSKMLSSVLLMFTIFSIWGLVSLLNSAFGITGSSAPVVSTPDAGDGGSGDFAGLMGNIASKVINPISKMLVALGFMYFLYGVGKYLKSPGEQKTVEEAKQAMIWGVLGMFVMVSVWGLVTVVIDTLGLQNNTPPIPKF